jgi:hypothetical protein
MAADYILLLVFSNTVADPMNKKRAFPIYMVSRLTLCHVASGVLAEDEEVCWD